MLKPRHVALPAVLLLAIPALQGCAHSASNAPANLDGDAIPDATVLLRSQPGGSGTFSYLAVVSGSSGVPRVIATALLGDRVQVRAVRIENARVVVDMRGHGPDDPSCCPSLQLRQTWQLNGAVLEEDTAARSSARTSVNELDGTHWELARWSAEEPASPAPVVTLDIAGGRLSGNAGCNRFGAAVRDGESPADLVVSAGMATRMACEDARMRIEERFLRILPTVTGFRYDQGMLVLAYRRDDGSGAELWFRVGSPS